MMSSFPIRVGLIGTSWWAAAMHLPSLASHPGATVAAICGRSRERAAALAAAHGIPAVFDDYEVMLRTCRLDALVVATPDDLHYPMTMAGLRRGLHVLCEKPLALTIDQAGAMLAAAEAAGVRHMAGFSWRGLPHYRHLRALVAAGYLGRFQSAQLSYLTGGGARAAYSWRYDRRRSNGALGNYGAHLIDLARWLVGDIHSVSAELSALIRRPGDGRQPAQPTNDVATLLVTFEGGAVGTIHASEVAETGERYHEQHIRLQGDAGSLEADLTLAGTGVNRQDVSVVAEVRGARRGEGRFQVLPLPNAIHVEADPSSLFEPFRRQPIGDRLFIDAIRAGRPASPDFADGYATQAVMDAALVAHQQGRRIRVARHDAVAPASLNKPDMEYSVEALSSDHPVLHECDRARRGQRALPAAPALRLQSWGGA
jgi:predicted dehydrogenase